MAACCARLPQRRSQWNFPDTPAHLWQMNYLLSTSAFRFIVTKKRD